MTSGTRRTTTDLFAITTSNEPGRLPRGLMVIAFSLLILVLLGVIFHQLSSILKPLFIAVLLCYLIMPIHRRLVRLHIPPVTSYVLIVLSFLVTMFAMWKIVSRSYEQFDRKMPEYEKKIDKIPALVNGMIDRFYDMLNKNHPPSETAEKPREEKVSSLSFFSRKNITGMMGTTLGTFIGFLTSLLVIAVYLAFLIAEGEMFRHRVYRVFGKDRGETVLEVVGTINNAISEYIAVKTSMSFVVALISTVIIWLFGVDFFLLWGILTFLFNFIPYIGSIIAAGLPIGLCLLQYDSPWKAVAVAALLIGSQMTTAYVLEPRIAGRRLGLSPLMILLSLAFWWWLWGIVGMILAVPMVASLKIMLDNIEQTRPIAAMMSRIQAEDRDGSGP